MKFLRVNMTDLSLNYQDIPDEYSGLGGRGLTSVMINNEVPAQCDPLGPDNKLIFATGILTGTPLVNTSRVSVGGKSPLTGGIKESNAGGTFAASLGKLGINAIIVEGCPADEALYVLKINAEGEPSLVSASDYKGMRTYALTEKLFEVHGEKSSILCIGPAGEFKFKSASIQSTDVDNRPCRAAGRGGLGAVMGSKGLKAIVVDRNGKTPDELSDPAGFKEAAKALAEAIQSNGFTGVMLPSMGTAALVSVVNGMGAFPSYNATKGALEGSENISGEALAKTCQERGGQVGHQGCSQCIIRCSNVYVDKKGEYITGSLEYETLWSMGGMTGINDLDAVARLDFLCDDIGLDTMNTGAAIGVAMDCGRSEFGDGAAAEGMLEEIAAGTAFGSLLGNGPEAVGNSFNHSRIPVVKGQSIAAYDPRGMPANGVTYATSPMGADHTAGNLVGSYLAGALDPSDGKAQVQASREAQISMAGLDCTGLCLLAGSALGTPEAGAAFVKMLSIRLGVELGPDAMNEMGVRTLKAEIEFNKKAGFTSKDDRLPEFFKEEELPPNNSKFAIDDEDLDGVFDF